MKISKFLSLMTIVLAAACASRPSQEKKRAEIKNLGQKLDMYYTDCGSYPKTKEGLNALKGEPSNCAEPGKAYLVKIPKDDAGNDFIYSSDGTSYTLKTNDDKSDTLDDDNKYDYNLQTD